MCGIDNYDRPPLVNRHRYQWRHSPLVCKGNGGWRGRRRAGDGRAVGRPSSHGSIVFCLSQGPADGRLRRCLFSPRRVMQWFPRHRFPRSSPRGVLEPHSSGVRLFPRPWVASARCRKSSPSALWARSSLT